LVGKRPKAQNHKKLYMVNLNLVLTDHTKNLVLVGKIRKAQNPKKLSVINLSFSLFTDHIKIQSFGWKETSGTKP
jgi:hypothetical protein